MTDTESIRLEEAANAVAQQEADADADSKTHAKRTPGKLPPMANNSKDSQEAAAAMLSKLRRRR